MITGSHSETLWMGIRLSGRVLTLLVWMFSAVFVAAQTVSCDDARVKYAPYKPAESQFQVEKLKQGPVPDEKELKKTPQFTRWRVRVSPIT